MNLTAIPPGARVFVDANIHVYHFAPHPIFGSDCRTLMRRIETSDIAGFAATHVIAEAAHRLMVLEAKLLFGWPSKVVDRLEQRPDALQQLTHFRKAVEDVLQSRIGVLIIEAQRLAVAVQISQQYGLLTNDEISVAVMQAQGIDNLASHDSDFDRVPGLRRVRALLKPTAEWRWQLIGPSWEQLSVCHWLCPFVSTHLS